jgi:hypothetical protein
MLLGTEREETNGSKGRSRSRSSGALTDNILQLSALLAVPVGFQQGSDPMQPNIRTGSKIRWVYGLSSDVNEIVPRCCPTY